MIIKPGVMLEKIVVVVVAATTIYVAAVSPCVSVLYCDGN